MPRRRYTPAVSFIVLVTLTLAACASPPPPPPLPPTPPAGWDQHYLTRDGVDSTSLRMSAADAGRVVTGASNIGRDSRTLFTRRTDAPSTDQEVCVRFRHSGGIAQEGVAFRVRDDNGRTRAVTVTKNIWFHANWLFNVHTWDTDRPGVFAQHAALDMSPALGTRVQGHEAWNLCGRAIDTRVDVRVWRQGEAEPEWDHPTVRSATIPPDFTAPGRPGWYAGHVERGHWTDLSAMKVAVLDGGAS